MDRRSFILAGPGLAIAGAGRIAHPSLDMPRAPASWNAPRTASTGRAERVPLPIPSEASPLDLELIARPTTVPGSGPVWSLNGSAPGPTLRAVRGERASIRLRNELDEPTILHWHGLNVPQQADGHPRLAIDPGQVYEYEFRVDDPAGTYWYHPHPHRRTGAQTYMGMAGLLLVHEPEEDELGLRALPEIPLLLQDKRLGPDGAIEYRPFGPDQMHGYLGDVAFVNGAADPFVEVDRGPHRLRILNGSNARILSLTLDGAPMTLIGSDGGLLGSPEQVTELVLGNGERVDLVVDFSERSPGDRLMLRSRAFDVPGMMMGMGRGRGRGRMGRGPMMMAGSQGTAMDFLEFRIASGPVRRMRRLPDRLPSLEPPHLPQGAPRQTFRFTSRMMQHTINGTSFEIDRVDYRIPLGETQIWTFVNDGELPHPVHVHAGQFRVLERSGGRNRLFPWERGRKDTVLIYPGERVDVLVRFPDHRGLYLLHCHNLEHEDMGMMANFLVE